MLLLAPLGLAWALFLTIRAVWRGIWWRARFEATMARELPTTRWPDHGVEGVPLGVVARRAVNVTTTPAPRQLGRDYHHGNPWHNRTPQLDRSPRQE